MGCITVRTTRQGGDCKVTTSLVCSVNMAKNYVRVEPRYLWLTDSNQFRDIVNVYSDGEWNAK